MCIGTIYPQMQINACLIYMLGLSCSEWVVYAGPRTPEVCALTHTH